jgi:hypothetical protein
MAHHHGRTQRSASLLSLAIATALFGTAAVGAHEVVSPQARTARVILPPGVYTGNEPGVSLLHDYGAFQLWRVDAAHAVELHTVAGANAKALEDVIEFEAAPFDPTQGAPQVPEAFRAGKTSGTALQLVQFVGPVTDAWLGAVAATGAKLVQYVPNNAYIVLADEASTRQLDKLAQSGDFLQYSASLQPFHKLDRGLAQRVSNGLQSGHEMAVSIVVASHGGNAPTKARVQ